MNRGIFRFLVVVLVTGLFFEASCQAKGLFEKKDKAKSVKPAEPAKTEAQQAEAPSSNARIKFDISQHDFGTLVPDSMNNCKFAFKNVGKDVLKIDRVQGTCKCTVPDLQKKEYAPGETGEITIEFHAPKNQGATSQHIIVFSNDSNSPRVELEIKGFVKLAVQVTPENINLSLLDPNAGTGPITIVSDDNETFAVTNIESTNNVVTFVFDPNNISKKHILKPVVDVAKLRNSLMGFITFTLNHPKCKEVRVQWSCLKEFEASPSVIILRNAVAGEVQKRIIYLTSNYNQPIVIESVTTDKGIIKVTNQQQTENKFQFDIDIKPPAKEGQLRVFADVLHIKIKGKEEIIIPCRGFYKADQ